MSFENSSLKGISEQNMSDPLKWSLTDDSRFLQAAILKDYADLDKLQLLSTDLASMDANTLNYWLSNFVQEPSNSEGKVYPARSFYKIICVIGRHLEETVGSELTV